MHVNSSQISYFKIFPNMFFDGMSRLAQNSCIQSNVLKTCQLVRVNVFWSRGGVVHYRVK